MGDYCLHLQNYEFKSALRNPNLIGDNEKVKDEFSCRPEQNHEFDQQNKICFISTMF